MFSIIFREGWPKPLGGAKRLFTCSNLYLTAGPTVTSRADSRSQHHIRRTAARAARAAMPGAARASVQCATPRGAPPRRSAPHPATGATPAIPAAAPSHRPKTAALLPSIG